MNDKLIDPWPPEKEFNLVQIISDWLKMIQGNPWEWFWGVNTTHALPLIVCYRRYDSMSYIIGEDYIREVNSIEKLSAYDPNFFVELEKRLQTARDKVVATYGFKSINDGIL